MHAVIQTGGKQYLVQKGDVISIEKLDKKEGSVVTFAEVLLTGDAKSVKLGSPTLKGVKVEGKVLRHDRDKKVTTVKHKKRKRQLKRQGHKQHKTVVEITKI